MTPEQERVVQKVTPDHICARCKKPFNVGNRVTWAFILLNPHAYNPNRITEKGLELGMDTEFAHVDCSDPFLDGKSAGKF